MKRENDHQRTFPRHLRLIPRPLSPLPKPIPSLLNQTRMTDPTVLRSVVLLTRAVSANHTISMFIGMVTRPIVAFVACKYFRAAAEAEPTVAFAVMLAAAAAGKFLAGDYT